MSRKVITYHLTHPTNMFGEWENLPKEYGVLSKIIVPEYLGEFEIRYECESTILYLGKHKGSFSLVSSVDVATQPLLKSGKDDYIWEDIKKEGATPGLCLHRLEGALQLRLLDVVEQSGSFPVSLEYQNIIDNGFIRYNIYE